MLHVTAGRTAPAGRRAGVLLGRRDVRGTVRPAPGAGVDPRAQQLDRRAARDGALPRHLPGAPGLDPAAARVLGTGRRPRPTRRVTGSRCPASSRSGRRTTGSPSWRGCAATLELADRGYQLAAAAGMEVQPGLARLRLAQGRLDAAAAGLDRALSEVGPAANRPLLLAARIDVALAATTWRPPNERCAELAALGGRDAPAYLRALAEQACGRGAAGRGRWRARCAAAPAPGLVALAGDRCARTRWPAPGCWSPGPAGNSVTSTPPRWRCRPARSVLDRLGAVPDVRHAGSDGRRSAQPPGTAGAATARHRCDEPGDRRGPRAVREDRGAARQQHLRQARRDQPGRRDVVRLPSTGWPDYTDTWPIGHRRRSWVIRPTRRRPPHSYRRVSPKGTT